MRTVCVTVIMYSHFSLNSRHTYKRSFELGDKSKMPLVLFGDGLTNRAQVRFKGLQAGVSRKIYKLLKTKEKQGLVLVLDIDEFRTSKVCNQLHMIINI
ncbi:hypothetical protein BDF20DRAFT_895957, partial [Mycotypha africana]|uniref:uncharacterized protein n=1 Tax=Mycotypha africana TaxID=64632 RepID=UPI002300D1E1